jgi:trehalose 6-phosphate synthase
MVIIQKQTYSFKICLGAILINPWNINEIKSSLKLALSTHEVQKISDHSHLLSYVKKFTSSYWGQSFVRDLQQDSSAFICTTQDDLSEDLPRKTV